MQRTPTTPDVGVEERRYRVGQDRPSETADKGISGKAAGERAKPAPPGTIGLVEARELFKITFIEPEGGYDPKRLSMALRMLISEEEFIDHFTRASTTHGASKTRKDRPAS